SFIAVNIYNQTFRRTEPYTLTRLQDTWSLPTTSLLAGDFNSHHHIWNSATSRLVNHEDTLRLMEELNLGLINEPDVPTHYPRNGNTPSVIDLAFATYPLLDLVSDWTVEERDSEESEAATTGSDHTVIRFEITSTQTESVPDPRSQRYKWKAANWDKFREKMLENVMEGNHEFHTLCNNFATNEDLDKAAQLLTKVIKGAVEVSVPELRLCSRSKVWWTDEIKMARKRLRHLERRWKAKRTSWKRRKKYKKARNAYFRLIRKSKKDAWDRFLAEAEGKEVFTAFNYTKPRRTQRTPSLQSGEKEVTTFEEKCELFREVMFPPPPTYNEEGGERPSRSRREALQWENIRDEEVREAIFTSSLTKVPGPDGL